jgi:hypothetical protein
MKKKLSVGKCVGCVSMAALFVAAITPGTFSIPSAVQPWLLLGSVIWIITFSSGVFSS